jgi:nitrogenase molybdenum-iron protein alpha chain
MADDIGDSRVPVREQRLGSITGYEGTASDLCRKSLEGKLKERSRSFSQCSICPSFAANFLATAIFETAVVNHAPLGCAGDFCNFNQGRRAWLKSHGGDPSNIPFVNTNLRESDMVFGGAEKLRRGVREAHSRFSPRAIFVTTSCASAIIGDDMEGILNELESELDLPIIPVHCEGFGSKVPITGADALYHGILQKIVKPARSKHADVVNVINTNNATDGVLT